MDRDDMVPALEEAHRLLGPKGTLIDIHHVAGTAEIEVRYAARVVGVSQPTMSSSSVR